MSGPPHPNDTRVSVPPPPAAPAWRRSLTTHPVLAGALLFTLLLLLATSGWVLARRGRYRAEIDRLRASMTTLEREQADEIVSQEHNTLRIALALLARQARLEPTLHLAVSIDTGAMYLERDGVLLREMPVRIGPERRIGVAPDTVRLAAPRGVRTVQQVLGDTTAWEVPTWVYADRGLPVDSNRSIPGALGPAAIVLDGGTVIYSTPAAGPLSDSLYVLPGAVRARDEDLRAILPNLTPGTRVYFY